MRIFKNSIFSVTVIFAIFTIIFTMVFSFAGPAAAQQEEDAKTNAAKTDYVAKVNDVKISQADMDRKFDLIRERYASMGVPLDESKIAEFRENILSSLIDQEVLFQEAKAQGIVIDPEAVKQALDDFKKQFETEADFEKQIESMNYTEDVILSQIRESKIIEKYIEDTVMPTITVTDADVKTYFDEHPEEFEMPERVHASHILLKVEPNASDASKAETRKEIEKIKTRLDEGEDFAKLAKDRSDCPSKEKGGDLGFFARGQMVKPFEDTAFSQEPGTISDVVETRFGYHLIQVQEKEAATKLAYDDIKDRLVEKLQQEKFKEMFPDYIESLKEKYTIDIPGPQTGTESEGEAATATEKDA